MSRHKEFDEAQVLEQALEVFRARGFKHTSFAELTAELGVSRQSLYDTYGDKHALYQAALKRYLDRAIAQIRQMLDDPAPVREVLGRFFGAVLNAQCAQGHHGCLMVNSMIELSQHDADTRALAIAHARELEGVIASRLSLAQRRGDVARSKDPVALARFFYHTVLGLAVAVRAFGDGPSLKQTARLALQVLD